MNFNGRTRQSVLACFDSFKECLNAQEIGTTVLQSLRTHSPYLQQFQKRTSADDDESSLVQYVNVPLSDGGEGFLHSFKQIHNDEECKSMSFNVCHPHEQQWRDREVNIPSAFLVLNDQIAVVESAKCVGLELIEASDRNPLNTTTYGLGLLLKHIIFDLNLRRICLGLGGTATSDGGIGLLQALGLKVYCLDEKKQRYEPDIFYGRHLPYLIDFDATNLIKEFPSGVQIDLACDVNNPFIGANGAVHVFSKQKGADTQEMRDSLEVGMVMLNSLFTEKYGVDLSQHKGTGAAGGISGSLYAVLSQTNANVSLKRGIEIIANSVNLEDKIAHSEIVLTGEGSYDGQTGEGKVVSLVQEYAQKHSIPLVIICGQCKVDVPTDNNTLVLALTPELFDVEKSMSQTTTCLDELIQINKNRFRFKPYHPFYKTYYTVPPRYRINLETPPRDRWLPIIHDFRDKIPLLKKYVEEQKVTEMKNKQIADLITSSIGWASKHIYTPTVIAEELTGIASITKSICGLTYADLLTLNMGYNYLAHCTSSISLDHNHDSPYHFRTMDWDLAFSDPLRELAVDVEFYENDKPLYIMTTWVGFLGGCTGMRFNDDGTGAYSISINYRKTDELGGFFKNLASGLASYWPIEFLMRKVLHKQTNYSDAIQKFSREKIMAPCYLTVCGTKNNEGTILTRTRLIDEKRQNIDVERTPFIIQTNHDHWNTTIDLKWAGTDYLLINSMDRLNACTKFITDGRAKSNELKYDQMDFVNHVGFGSNSNFPNLNPETVYQVVMRPSSGLYLTRVPFHPVTDEEFTQWNRMSSSCGEEENNSNNK